MLYRFLYYHPSPDADWAISRGCQPPPTLLLRTPWMNQTFPISPPLPRVRPRQHLFPSPLKVLNSCRPPPHHLRLPSSPQCRLVSPPGHSHQPTQTRPVSSTHIHHHPHLDSLRMQTKRGRCSPGPIDRDLRSARRGKDSLCHAARLQRPLRRTASRLDRHGCTDPRPAVSRDAAVLPRRRSWTRPGKLSANLKIARRPPREAYLF